MTPSPPLRDRRAWLILVVAILAVTALRLVGLWTSATDLYVDEAQYWSWAQHPAWGYYSKPPLIAWLIGLSQSVCGTGEACVRAPSALAWAVTAAAVAGVGATLYGRAVGLWAGLSALLAPGAAYSARIISTDAPLLAFWSLALLAFVRLRAGGCWGWGVLLAAGVGFGLLSKYAMAYFLGGLLLAALVDPASRRALRRPPVWGGLLAGLLVLLPNLAWQAANGMATLRHTAGNAASGGEAARLGDGLGFVAAQFALAGPVIFAAACAAVWLWARGRPLQPQDRLLLAFSAPILLVLTVLAFISPANGNWAATALVAVFVLGPALLLRWRRRAWLIGGLAFGVILQLALPLADAHAWNLSVGGRPVFERTLGWRPFAAATFDRARAVDADIVVAERRRDIAALLYYGREQAIPVVAWPAPDTGPQDHFQMDRPLTAAAARGRGVLALTTCPGADRFAGWARVEDIGDLTTPSGAGAVRHWRLYRLEGPPPVVRRPPPCP